MSLYTRENVFLKNQKRTLHFQTKLDFHFEHFPIILKKKMVLFTYKTNEKYSFYGNSCPNFYSFSLTFSYLPCVFHQHFEILWNFPFSISIFNDVFKMKVTLSPWDIGKNVLVSTLISNFSFFFFFQKYLFYLGFFKKWFEKEFFLTKNIKKNPFFSLEFHFIIHNVTRWSIIIHKPFGLEFWNDMNIP